MFEEGPEKWSPLEGTELMTRIARWLLLSPLLITLGGPAARAQTINAASCSSSAVQAAFNSVAADGTTVNIPAGTCTWSSSVNYTANFSVTIRGQTTVTGTCGPGGQCTPADNTAIQDATGSAALHVNTVNGKSVRITGLSFIWGSGAQQYVGMLYVTGNTQSLRIDHCHFYHANIVDLLIHGNKGPLYGVVDHNMFNAGGGNEDAFRVEHSNWNGSEPSTTPGYVDGLGNTSWADASYWGSNKFVFIENNTFAFDGGSSGHAFAYDCTALGGRMVFRYNNVTPNMALQTHGTGSGDHNYRSCREMEIYGNNFDYNSNPASFNFPMLLMLEGGGLYLWNNTVSGFRAIVDMDLVRTNTLTYQEGGTPGDWGYCSASAINGVAGPSPWDANLSGQSGGPCLDQTGRGKGDLVTGIFPTKVDSLSGTIAWPNQAYDPAYVWGNTFNPVPQNQNFYWFGTASGSVQSDRDMFFEVPRYGQAGTFNGSSGIGCGPSGGVGCSNPVPQPATCAQFTGYWNPATNTLYQCSATNTWVAYYAPYTYPHPLTVGSGTPPAPPTNLQSVVH